MKFKIERYAAFDYIVFVRMADNLPWIYCRSFYTRRGAMKFINKMKRVMMPNAQK